jgi:hypothetical protein
MIIAYMVGIPMLVVVVRQFTISVRSHLTIIQRIKNEPRCALARNRRMIRALDVTRPFGAKQFVKASNSFMRMTAAKFPGGGHA